MNGIICAGAYLVSQAGSFVKRNVLFLAMLALSLVERYGVLGLIAAVALVVGGVAMRSPLVRRAIRWRQTSLPGL